MRYMGGKSRLAKRLAEYLESRREPGQLYWEPFVGGASVIARMGDHGPRIGSDANEALITLYRAMQNGWEPPEALSEEEYRRLKEAKDPSDPLTAFAGFGCSFGGAWFHAYARGGGRDYPAEASRSLARMAPSLSPVRWIHRTYSAAPPPSGALIYCDPPYRDTHRYRAVGAFDSDRFWAWAAETSETSTVLVSEYQAPAGWSVALEIPHKCAINNQGGSRPTETAERLFEYAPT
jgi:DNA adenine methylase